ncbi:phage tail assembly chaperone [Cohaesibacter celericrescens]|uniref:Phage tail assembly chaperone n=2 Tax=Cohaesibacter celericrescens TaxID=2067669 RepID=A0A2N5XR62_9HYPH|nr:phage tail assembly chaperone [Cohaesibacter celericrescens]
MQSLGWAPQTVWGVTPKELLSAIGASPATSAQPSRNALAQLCEAFPDSHSTGASTTNSF